MCHFIVFSYPTELPFDASIQTGQKFQNRPFQGTQIDKFDSLKLAENKTNTTAQGTFFRAKVSRTPFMSKSNYFHKEMYNIFTLHILEELSVPDMQDMQKKYLHFLRQKQTANK